jgi:hypothetical protein
VLANGRIKNSLPHSIPSNLWKRSDHMFCDKNRQLGLCSPHRSQTQDELAVHIYLLNDSCFSGKNPDDFNEKEFRNLLIKISAGNNEDKETTWKTLGIDWRIILKWIWKL